MQAYVDFLNHGVLPFAGREEDAERIIEFWRGGLSAPGLQAMLVRGEAGVGKSRLIEEVALRVTSNNGAVIHAKFYPESPTSLVSLIVRALWRFASAYPSLKLEPKEELGSIIASLRRLARLRQTLLVFEDLHLLGGDGLGDFSTLMSALTDEPLSLLCIARPVDLAARPLLERYLISEIELLGLDRGEIERIWNRVFRSPVDEQIVNAFVHATAGNPLALRSALRGALRSGTIAQDAQGGWRLVSTQERFEQEMARSVELLSEGMTAHLSASERLAAETIATLGEVVSREAVDAMVDDAEEMLGLLVFKGILGETVQAIPSLTGERSRFPLLAFTHSLLHRRLLQDSSIDASKLLKVVADGLPIYSIVPMQALGDAVASLKWGGRNEGKAIERLFYTMVILDRGADWRLGRDLWSTADALLRRFDPQWSRSERIRLMTGLLNLRISLFHKRNAGSIAEHEAAVAALLELTEAELPDGLEDCRLTALGCLHWLNFRKRADGNGLVHDEIRSLVDRFPMLRATRPYSIYLRSVAHAARVTNDIGKLREVERDLAALMALSSIPESLRTELWQRIAPQLLVLFETPEEVEDRLRLLKELLAEDVGDDLDLPLLRLNFLTDIGEFRTVVKIAPEVIARFRETGYYRSLFYSELLLIVSRAALGEDLARIEEELDRIFSEKDPVVTSARTLGAGFVVCIGLMLGRASWAGAMLSRILPSGDALSWDVAAYLALSESNVDALRVLSAQPEQSMLRTIVLWALGEVDSEIARDAILEVLQAPLIRFTNVLAIRAIVEAVDLFERSTGSVPPADLRKAVGNAVLAGFKWLESRGLWMMMDRLIDSYGHRFSRMELSGLARRRSALRASVAGSEPVSDAAEMISVTMFGTIEVVRPGEESQRLRGDRVRTLLGLMVADAILMQPLSVREFYRLAVEDTADPDDARKTVNLAVHRLREILGYEAIRTGDEAPALNRSLVRVDLLDSYRHLREALDALADGRTPLAFTAILAALDIWRGDVPFPALYDEFFASAREDFESRMRRAVLLVSKELLREGDDASGRQVLERAFAAMPGDQELATMLSDLLVRLGDRVEAQRVRLRVVDSVRSSEVG